MSAETVEGQNKDGQNEDGSSRFREYNSTIPEIDCQGQSIIVMDLI